MTNAEVRRVQRREPSLTTTAVPWAMAWATVSPLSLDWTCCAAQRQVGGEGEDGFLEGGRSHIRLLRDGDANVLHSGNGSGHSHRCTGTIARGGLQQKDRHGRNSGAGIGGVRQSRCAIHLADGAPKECLWPSHATKSIRHQEEQASPQGGRPVDGVSGQGG